MARWHHQPNGHEFEQSLDNSEGQTVEDCVLKSMGLRRVRHDLAIEQQQHKFNTFNTRKV